MTKLLNLAEMAQGAFMEQFNLELAKVLENIKDPNTDAKKPRELYAREGRRQYYLSSACGIPYKQVFADAPEAQAVISRFLHTLIRYDDMAMECRVKPDVGEFLREYTGRRA